MSDGPQSLSAASAGGGPELENVRTQVDRILASNTFRAAEVLRRLLRFLADKTFSGEADYLKEYSIGLDALGKPPTYDPSKDAIVRLQASRLRQKLDEYYRSEGRDDSLVIELPRGRFKISWRLKVSDAPADTGTPKIPAAITVPENTAPPNSDSVRRWRNTAILMAGVSALLACVAWWALYRVRDNRVPVAVIGEPAAPLAELWRPFLFSKNHLLIAFSNPFFVRLQDGGYRDVIYHTMGVNSWDDAKGSAELSALQRALGSAKASPTFNMVERSTMISTFVLSRFLAPRLPDISLVRSSDVSWQHLADNDVIFLTGLSLDRGNPALPVRPAFSLDSAGVRNPEPAAGELSLYPDPQDHQESDGEGLELVSMLPGPLGRTSVMTFASNHAWGIICGVQALTDPSFVRVLAARLKSASGELPPYYQVVIKISYRDGTPTTAHYVTHRVLTLK